MRQKKLLSLIVMTAAMLFSTAMAEISNTWMPDRYKTLQPIFSNAQEFENAKDSFILGLPDGMKAECTMDERGVIVYTIDSANTDWEKVIASAYEPSTGNVLIHPGVKMPAGAKGQRFTPYMVEPFPQNLEENILNRLNSDYNQYGANPGDPVNSCWIGTYDEATGTFLPAERVKWPIGLAVSWYPEQSHSAENTVLSSEYILFGITFTNMDAITVSLPKVPKDDIIPNVPVSSSGHGTAIQASKEDGLVRYEVNTPEQLQLLSVTTAVTVPQLKGKDTSNWICQIRSTHESAYSPCQMAEAGQYGLTRRSALIPSELSRQSSVKETDYVLQWVDQNKTVQYVQRLSDIIICGEKKPWPVYAGWNPVPENRIKLTYVNPIKSGTRLTYDEATGIAYFHIDLDQLPETAAYGDANFVMEFTPPEGATAYACFNGNSENTFGYKDYVSQNMQSWIEQSGRFPCSDGFQRTQQLFREHRQESSDLTIFSSDMISGELASEYLIINWYRNINDKEPMLTEYVFRRMDNCIRMEVSEPLSGDDEIAGRITSTAIVIPNDNSAKQMQFVAEMYPQEAEHSRFYELRLLDKHGERANLPANSKVILPYPEGTSFEDLTISFSLRHLNAKYQTFEIFSEENGRLHREKDHLWFIPKSLSPFVLEWGEAAPIVPSEEPTLSEDAVLAVDLPKTGDSSHLLAAAAALSAAGTALYLRRKRRSN